MTVEQFRRYFVEARRLGPEQRRAEMAGSDRSRSAPPGRPPSAAESDGSASTAAGGMRLVLKSSTRTRSAVTTSRSTWPATSRPPMRPAIGCLGQAPRGEGGGRGIGRRQQGQHLGGGLRLLGLAQPMAGPGEQATGRPPAARPRAARAAAPAGHGPPARRKRRPPGGGAVRRARRRGFRPAGRGRDGHLLRLGAGRGGWPSRAAGRAASPSVAARSAISGDGGHSRAQAGRCPESQAAGASNAAGSNGARRTLRRRRPASIGRVTAFRRPPCRQPQT